MVDTEIQTDTLILEETTQLFEQNATIRRLEEELLQSQQTLTQNIGELLTITEQFQEQSTIMNRLEAELAQTQQALIRSREEMNEYQASQSRAQGAIIHELK
jgi:hydroxymethylpyrimidine/phosphomethylpyrimidine kinase